MLKLHFYPSAEISAFDTAVLKQNRQLFIRSPLFPTWSLLILLFVGSTLSYPWCIKIPAAPTNKICASHLPLNTRQLLICLLAWLSHYSLTWSVTSMINDSSKLWLWLSPTPYIILCEWFLSVYENNCEYSLALNATSHFSAQLFSGPVIFSLFLFLPVHLLLCLLSHRM